MDSVMLALKCAARSFAVFDRLRTYVLLYFEKKSHVINQKREHCPTFLKSYMINHNAQKSSDFLRYIL